MTFQYQPLPRDKICIRILGLWPGQKSDRIRCSLQHCEFPTSESGAYEPLSYCWGDGQRKASIDVNRYPVEINRALHAALIRLRFRSETRRLWVDALCINQEDDDEKNAQVQIMREIYRHGKQTLVWLGSGSFSGTRRGFSIISKLAEAHQMAKEIEDLPFVYYRDPPRTTMEYNARRSQFLAIFALPYFTRVWIIQEIAVSPSVQVFCGNDSVSWDMLENAVRGTDLFLLEAFEDMNSLELFRKVCAARSKSQTNVKQDLLQILLDHRSASATCAKDKIYALMGVANLFKDYDIIPNYKEGYKVEDMYIDSAKSILKGSKTLDLLSVPGRSASTGVSPRLPTWVPDRSAPSAWHPIAPPPELPESSATGRSTSRLELQDERKALGLQGHVFARVEQIGCASPELPMAQVWEDGSNVFLQTFVSNLRYWRFEALNLKAWKSWLFLTLQASGERSTERRMSEAFLNTCTAGYTTRNVAEQASIHAEIEKRLGDGKGPSGIFDRPMIWIAYTISRSAFHVVRDVVLRIREPQLGENDPLIHTFGRNMFTTKEGYIGLGPSTIRIGDCLVLCEGGRVPYVLRGKGQDYNFVGDCYVHGIMQGELFDQTKCEQIWLI